MIRHLLPLDIRWWQLEFDICRELSSVETCSTIYCQYYYDPIFLGC